MTNEDCEDLDYLVMLMTQLHLENIIKLSIDCQTSGEMWNKLHDANKESTKSNKVNLMQGFRV